MTQHQASTTTQSQAATARSAGPSGSSSGLLVSGIGSWPGTDVREPLRVLREVLGGLDPDADGVTGVPYLPELPGRGPGGDLIGRSAGLLVDLHVDLQPSGWRLVSRPGRDAARTDAYWREDLDELAEHFSGYAGPLKVAVAGPWTLSAGLWLTRGERALADEGAAADLAESLAEGVRTLLGTLTRLLPDAELILQVDEPSLPAVLDGRLPTASGLSRVPAVDPQVAQPALARVLAAAGGRHTVVHCCAAHPPQPLIRGTGATGLSLDTALLTLRGWEGLAVAAEEGRRPWLGAVPTDPVGELPAAGEIAESVAATWTRLGMPPTSLTAVAITPACGLAGLTPAAAVARQRLAVEVARHLAQRALG